MNDPNGMFYDDATQLWHLYYQHNPFGTTWGPMHWAHATSTDLIHWEQHPIALAPDSLGTIFSGSIVIDRNNTAGFGENAIVAIYTQSEICGQHQSIAYSLDGGMTFTKYEGNPVLKGDIADFRDPKVFWDEQTNRWMMILACQQEVRFSDYALNEIDQMNHLIAQLHEAAMQAYHKMDMSALGRANQIEDEIDRLTDEMERNHIQRLSLGICKPQAGTEYISLAQNSERVADHLINVAKTIRDLQ
jgi:sucrose-6-phosphate hydrolase SacC (GH32 family)